MQSVPSQLELASPPSTAVACACLRIAGAAGQSAGQQAGTAGAAGETACDSDARGAGGAGQLPRAAAGGAGQAGSHQQVGGAVVAAREVEAGGPRSAGAAGAGVPTVHAAPIHAAVAA